MFYPSDWTSGTMHLNFEEKGAYFELLMLQFNVGHMTYHMIGRVLGQEMDKIWPAIESKFVKDSTGKFFNERLELEKNRRKAFTESRRNNVEGKNQYSKKDKKEGHTTKHMDGHKTSHMENVNINGNIDTDKSVNVNKEPAREIIYDRSIHDCYSACLKHFPEHLHPKNPNTWLDAIEKLHRIDGLEFDMIESIVEKTRADDFWAKNFLSLPKLRTKNKDGIMYVVVFGEQLRIKHNQQNGKSSTEQAIEYARQFAKEREDKARS